jgi:hypothetical protein
MEIKVGQKWKSIGTKNSYVVTDILVGKHNTYIESKSTKIKHFDNYFVETKEAFLVDNELIFRPHWLLDTSDKIYADEIQNYLNLYNLDSYFIKNRIPVNEYVPYQCETLESDFDILFEDGSYMKATWVGKED